MRLVEPTHFTPAGVAAKQSNAVLEWAGGAQERFRIAVLEEDIVRVQLWPHGSPTSGPTWMIVDSNGDVPLEGRNREELSRFGQPSFECTEEGGEWVVRTKALGLRIGVAAGISLTWCDSAGADFAADLPRGAYLYDKSGPTTAHYMRRRETESYYGFGERGGPLNKKGRRMRLACFDAMGYRP